MHILGVMLELDAPLSGYLTHHKSGYFRDLALPVTMRHDPVDHLLIWVIEGGITGAEGGAAFAASAGDLVLLAPHTPQRYAPAGSAWQWFWVHYGGRAAPAVHRLLRGNGGPVAALGADASVRYRFRELATAAEHAGAPRASQLHLDSCLLSLTGLMAERQARRDVVPGSGQGEPVVAGLRIWITDHLDEPITLPRLSSHSGYSASALARLFRRTGAGSPMAFVTGVRMRHACDLLAETDLSVRQVGRAVGFDDPYHFSRRFRATMGCAPTAYRADAMLRGRTVGEAGVNPQPRGVAGLWD